LKNFFKNFPSSKKENVCSYQLLFASLDGNIILGRMEKILKKRQVANKEQNSKSNLALIQAINQNKTKQKNMVIPLVTKHFVRGKKGHLNDVLPKTMRN
jgi:hypothetical protein